MQSKPNEVTPEHWAVLVIPRLRVQNANAISSPMTWGFPSMTAFLGLMTSLERRLGVGAGISFKAVGVICHNFEAQVTEKAFTRAFHLTRNPLGKDGSTAGIAEEGRVHLELSIVFSVQIATIHLGEAERKSIAIRVADELGGMRLAGGSFTPNLPGTSLRSALPSLTLEAQGEEAERQQMRELRRICLPGFALVSRHDLLVTRLEELRSVNPELSALEAWLDLSRWNHHAEQGDKGEVFWQTDPRKGWTVPIPIGYTSLSDLYAPGSVDASRDGNTPFRFVETVWSMGEWISPHRLKSLDDLFWYARIENELNPTYRCLNDYTPERADLTTA